MSDIPTATGAFVWNCRDCGFTGTWLTSDGTCPKCGGRDLPTEPARSEPADFGGGESTGVQEL